MFKNYVDKQVVRGMVKCPHYQISTCKTVHQGGLKSHCASQNVLYLVNLIIIQEGNISKINKRAGLNKTLQVGIS